MGRKWFLAVGTALALSLGLVSITALAQTGAAGAPGLVSKAKPKPQPSPSPAPTLAPSPSPTPTPSSSPTPPPSPTPLPGSWKDVPSQSVPSGYPSNQNQALRSIAMLAANDGWAVGWAPDGSASTKEVTLSEHWNGSQWSRVSSPDPSGFWQEELHAVSGDSSTDVWAVGDSINSSVDGSDQTLVERWNGSQWSIVPTPVFSPGFGHLNGVKVFASNDVWAVGSYSTSAGDDPELTLTLHWNGSAWARISTPNPNSLSNRLLAITGTSSSDIWAGGLAGADVSFEPLALHWNGSSWSSSLLPDIQTQITALAALPSTSGPSRDVWAVGYAYGAQAGYLDGFCSHWNGSTWSNFFCGGELGPMYSVSAVASNFVWAVGGQGTPTINNWDGYRWNSVSTSQVHASIIYGVSVATSSVGFAVGAQLTTDPAQSVKTAAEMYSIP